MKPRKIEPRSAGSPQVASTGAGGSLNREAPQADVQRLLAELTNLEAKVYAADPALRAYEQYRNVPHEWMTQKGLQDKWQRFAGEPLPEQESRERREAMTKLRELLEPIVLHDLAADRFRSLYVSVIDAAPVNERQKLWSHADQIVGLQGNAGDTPLPDSPAAEEVLQHFDVSYSAIRHANMTWCREHGIPQDVYEALRDDTIYRQLTSMLDAYIYTHTPEELRKLRDQVRRLDPGAQGVVSGLPLPIFRHQ